VDAPLKKIPSWILLGAGVVALWQVTQLENVSTISWSLMLTYPLVGLGTSLLLFAVMQSNLGILTVLLRNRVSAYLGKISYGLYVYHIAGLHYGYKITEWFISPDRPLAYPVAGLFAGLVVTVFASMISYHALERPFLRIKERFAVIESRPA
jgi:peptidoglycan/LPS O-acetylase OafA/YrhL